MAELPRFDWEKPDLILASPYLRVLQTALSQQRDTVGRLRRVHELIEREHDAVAEARLAMRPPTAAWPPPAFASPWAPRRPVWPMWGGAAAPASWAAGGAAADTVDVDAAEPLGDVAEDLERETSGVRGAVTEALKQWEAA